MVVSYTILVSLTFILLTELSQILIEMHEGSKYVLQMHAIVHHFGIGLNLRLRKGYKA